METGIERLESDKLIRPFTLPPPPPVACGGHNHNALCTSQLQQLLHPTNTTVAATIPFCTFNPPSVILQTMAAIHNPLPLHKAASFLSPAPPSQLQKPGGHPCDGFRRRVGVCRVRAEALQSPQQGEPSRRHLLALGTVASCFSLTQLQDASLAAEAKKGFISVFDKKDGYSFLYPFGWQEVVVQGEDKVYKDVIEPLESVSVNLIPTSKTNIRELGSPKEVAETLIKKVLAPPLQKTKLIEASEHDVDGTTYYTFEFVAQAPNFTRHALGSLAIANGNFYTLTTGANERRWEKMKDRLHTVVESFKISSV